MVHITKLVLWLESVHYKSHLFDTRIRPLCNHPTIYEQSPMVLIAPLNTNEGSCFTWRLTRFKHQTTRTTMKYLTLLAIVTIGTIFTITSCKKDDDCDETVWYQDADGDGLGNANVSIEDCDQPTGYVSNSSDTDDTGGTTNDKYTTTTPISAFDEFNSASVTVSFDGDNITLESTALPNHTSPYWDASNALYISPVVAVEAQMSPGKIEESSYTLTVSTDPEKATSTSATGLGAIGISVTGVPIFNDEEGPNVQLSENVASGFDYAGGHNGPTGYHYHLESQDVAENTVLSHDDEDLNGIMSDGFLLYGRKCNSTGDHPTDLDASGGHISTTQHSGENTFYHYHIINEFYTGTYIVLFGVDLKGTPNTIL